MPMKILRHSRFDSILDKELNSIIKQIETRYNEDIDIITGNDDTPTSPPSGIPPITMVHDAVKIQGKTVDVTDIGDGKVLQYNSSSGNLEYETPVVYDPDLAKRYTFLMS